LLIQAINHIEAVWEVMPITMTPYKDEGMYRLKITDELMQTLEDHQVQLSSMKATR
jgi:dynein heavy chain